MEQGHVSSALGGHSGQQVARRVLSQLRRLLRPLAQVPGPWALAITCALAFAWRFAISIESYGSNDIGTWARFADYVVRYGLLRLYVIDPKFNHPPLMGWYGVFADSCVPIFQTRFSITFKVLPIVASTCSIFLVQRMAKLKLIWLLLFAFNPTDVLISAYHGNTDSVCVAFCVLSVFFADRESPWLSGFALGAAMNVKLIPVVLIAPLFLSLPRRQMWRFGLALVLCMAPFIPIFLGPWAAFKRNAIDYNSSVAKWGVGLLVSLLDGRLQPLQARAHWLTIALGKPLIWGSSITLGLLQQRYRLFTRAELCTIAYSCFLVFAPGFGVQYLVFPCAFFAASRVKGGFWYVYLSSAFAFLIYFGFWSGTLPAASLFARNFDERSTMVGLLTWLWLCAYLVQVGKRVVQRVTPVTGF